MSHESPDPLSPPQMRWLLRAAARVAWASICDEPARESAPVDPALEGEGGAFVTLKRSGELAGCIGFVEAPAPLWSTVEQAAEGAVLRDPRFARLESSAKDELTIELSVLSRPLPTTAMDFEPGIHGLILESLEHRGLLLPQVATEHGLEREAFLDALCHKSMLPAGAWRESTVQLRAFTVQTDAAPLASLLEGPS